MKTKLYQKVKEFKELPRRDRKYFYSTLTPFIFAASTAIYIYFELSAAGIISPTLWIATALASFLVFVVVYFICMTIYLTWLLL
jgi:hypothetical protein